MQNKIHLSKDFGWFIGSFDNNKEHRHYAIQLSIPLGGAITVKTPQKTIETEKPVLIQSNVLHQINSLSRHFLLLINPASPVGHFWKNVSGKGFKEFDDSPAKELKKVLTQTVWPDSITESINNLIMDYDCFCSSALHQRDERISKALLFLTENYDRVVPLEETANHCHLSPSRFLHLFKEHTGITYRRAQLWTKVSKSIALFGEKSFTEIAYEVGFSDSAHFSRVFKENFGFSPGDFSKVSHFIQE